MIFQQVESHEPGSTTYNEQLWRRSRNEKIIGETQTQAEIAGMYSSFSAPCRQHWSAFSAHCEWDRPVSTLHATGTPLKVNLHAFDTLLVSANEYDKIRCGFLSVLCLHSFAEYLCSVWDWAQRKPLGIFSNGNPPSSSITSLRFINDDTDGLVVAGSCTFNRDAC